MYNTHMKIYRFEHKTLRIGPLCAEAYKVHNIFWLDLFKNHSNVEYFEHFSDYLPEGLQSHLKFGMSTLEGLLDLCYSHTPEDLLEYGFDLFEFEVADDSVVFIDGQVVFDSRTATRID